MLPLSSEADTRLPGWTVVVAVLPVTCDVIGKTGAPSLVASSMEVPPEPSKLLATKKR